MKKEVIQVKTYNTRRKGFISVYHLIYSSRNPPTGSCDLKYHYSATNF